MRSNDSVILVTDLQRYWSALLIASRFGYCNSLFYGIPEYQQQKLHRIQNVAARLPNFREITLSTLTGSQITYLFYN